MPINTEGTLRPYFTQGAIADTLEKLSKPQTPILNLIYPEPRRKQKTSPFIPVSDITDVSGAPPVIRRGSSSYPVDTGTSGVSLVEVQPVSLNRFISGKEINDLISIGNTAGIKSCCEEAIERLRDKTSEATEIMARQSLSGEVQYPLAVNGGIDGTYKVTFGVIKEIAAVNIASDNLAKLQVKLEELYKAQLNTGASGDVRILAGDEVYAKMCEIIYAAASAAPVVWSEWGFTLLGKYKVMSMGMTYVLPGKTAAQSVIPVKYIQSIDVTNAGTLFYAALDDLDSQLAPLPFYAKPIKIDDPSGIKIISESKPLPAPAVSKMVRRKML